MTNGSASLPRENQQWSLHEGAQAKRGSLSDESRLRSICGKEEGTAITQFSAPTSPRDPRILVGCAAILMSQLSQASHDSSEGSSTMS